jgi:hypothetical protein
MDSFTTTWRQRKKKKRETKERKINLITKKRILNKERRLKKLLHFGFEVVSAVAMKITL